MSLTVQAWPAPAKINLFLHIVGRRPDGYHLLQTAFQFLDFGDELRFELNDDGGISRASDLSGVPEQEDISVRAAKLLQEQTGVQQGVTIDIEKHIPMGGGLGGGSSDAATTLLALNKLWGCQLSLEQLMAMGLKLGADVPVFIGGQACWAEGVGEILSPIIPPENWFLVIKPPVSVPTHEIFNDTELTRDSDPITIRDLGAGDTRNDCEPVVKKCYPEVGHAMQWLSQYTKSHLTGTGACVFGKFEQQSHAQATLVALNDYNRRKPKAIIGDGFIAKGLNRSPVHALLK